jgi:hypothetical protein
MTKRSIDNSSRDNAIDLDGKESIHLHKIVLLGLNLSYVMSMKVIIMINISSKP